MGMGMIESAIITSNCTNLNLFPAALVSWAGRSPWQAPWDLVGQGMIGKQLRILLA
jgi:hypothetical protein